MAVFTVATVQVVNADGGPRTQAWNVCHEDGPGPVPAAETVLARNGWKVTGDWKATAGGISGGVWEAGVMPIESTADPRPGGKGDMSEIKGEPLLLLVVTVPVEGGGPDQTEWVGECPHCGVRGLDIVREVAVAVRHNSGELEIEDGRIAISWQYGDGEFQHERYECQACGKPVRLPAEIEDEDD